MSAYKSTDHQLQSDGDGETVVHALYRAAAQAASFHSVLMVIKAALGADHCAVVALEPRRQSVRPIICDPAVSRCVTCPTPIVFAGRQMLGAEAGSVLSLACPTDAGAADGLSAPPFSGQRILLGLLERDRDGDVYVVFERPRGHPFEAADVQSLRQFMEHLRHAKQVHDTVRTHQAVANALHRALAEVLEILPVAAALLDEGGNVLLANKAAARFLAAADGVAMGADGLRLRQFGCTVSVSGILRRQAQVGDGVGAMDGDIIVVQRSVDRPLHAAILPLGETRMLGPSRPVALIMFHDLDRPVQLDVVALRKMFGFTEAEIRVATLLVNGRRPDQVAAELNISLHTARTHIKRALSKVGAVRQAELVRVLLCCFRRR